MTKHNLEGGKCLACGAKYHELIKDKDEATRCLVVEKLVYSGTPEDIELLKLAIPNVPDNSFHPILRAALKPIYMGIGEEIVHRQIAELLWNSLMGGAGFAIKYAEEHEDRIARSFARSGLARLDEMRDELSQALRGRGISLGAETDECLRTAFLGIYEKAINRR